LVIHAANPDAGKKSDKLSFTIRDSVEDTINVEIKLENTEYARYCYQSMNLMDTIVKITYPEFQKIDQSDIQFRPFTLGQVNLHFWKLIIFK
jgi:hypothetical protein